MSAHATNQFGMQFFIFSVLAAQTAVAGDSKKGKEDVKAQQQQKTQQALRLTKAAGESEQMAVARVKSAASTGSENLTAINQEALLELNQHLLWFPHKTLVLLRMAQKEEFFKEASMLPGDWLLSTLIYMKSAGKANIKDAIMMYAIRP